MLVVDCDYQSSDMRAVEQPARWVASEPQKAAFSDGSVQQNAGDGNMQGSPLGRFAWPCVFPSPAINYRPVEINSEDIRYALFRDRAGLLRAPEDAVEFLAQRRHIPADLVIGNLGVDLGRGDMFMFQHLLTVSRGTSCASVTVMAKVCRLVWNIQGEASNNEQVKIKRKSFEMSCISVFCKMWKMQTTTEY